MIYNFKIDNTVKCLKKYDIRLIFISDFIYFEFFVDIIASAFPLAREEGFQKAFESRT